MNCYNCKFYNSNNRDGLPKPCQFRKAMCTDSKFCKHFVFLANIGDKFITQCSECGKDMETEMCYFGGHSTWCPVCREKDKLAAQDLMWRAHQCCRYCWFFWRVEESRLEARGLCAINADESKEDAFRPYHSSGFSRRCPCFSFSYKNFKLALVESEKRRNWDVWIEYNMRKLAKGKFKSMAEYYEAVHMMVPDPVTGRAIPTGDDDFWK